MANARTVVKTVKNAKLFSDGSILIQNVRASYANLFKARAGKDDAGNATAAKFGMVGLAEKKTHKEALALLVTVIDDILKEKNKGGKIKADSKFVRDGDLQGKDEYDGMWSISASEQEVKPPKLRMADGNAIERTNSQHADILYSGCYVDMLVKPWFQDNDYGKKVNANLLAVRFVKDGTRFGEAPISDDDVDGSFDFDDADVDGNDGDDDDGL